MRKYRFSSEPRPQRPAEKLLEGIPEAMTTPDPFPPALQTAITEALAEHREQLDQTACSEYECSCGFEPEPVETRIWRGKEIGIVDEDWFAAHQVAVVKEVIAQQGRQQITVAPAGAIPEWAVLQPDLKVAEDQAARLTAATDWQQQYVVHTRLVFPWQEVKA